MGIVCQAVLREKISFKVTKTFLRKYIIESLMICQKTWVQILMSDSMSLGQYLHAAVLSPIKERWASLFASHGCREGQMIVIVIKKYFQMH